MKTPISKCANNNQKIFFLENICCTTHFNARILPCQSQQELWTLLELSSVFVEWTVVPSTKHCQNRRGDIPPDQIRDRVNSFQIGKLTAQNPKKKLSAQKLTNKPYKYDINRKKGNEINRKKVNTKPYK